MNAIEPSDENDGDSPAEPLTLQEFFTIQSQRPSAAIYQGLATDPILGEISRRKKLNYREMLIVVTTIVSSLDNEIRRLQKYERTWTNATRIINAPLFAAALKPNQDQSKKEEPEVTPGERHWFSRYLTLRNTLAVLMVVVTSAAGFFAWWNQDYRSLLSGREQRMTDAFAERDLANTAKKKSEDALQTERNNSLQFQQDIRALQGRLGAAEDERNKAQGDLIQLRGKKADTLSAEAKTQVNLANQVAELSKQKSETERKLSESQKSVEEWKQAHNDKESTLKTRTEQKEDVEKQKADVSRKLDAAIDAWNQLVTFFGYNTNSSEVKLSRKELQKQFQTLETYTDKVNGMKKSFQ